MFLIADRPDPAVERALRFVSDMLGARGTAFYHIAIEDRRPFDFVLHEISVDFHRTYVTGMMAHDPLGVPRLIQQTSSVVCLEQEGRKVDQRSFGAYRAFMDAFGMSESVEFVFRSEGAIMAGMSVSWVDVRRRMVDQAAALHTVQSYLEFNLSHLRSPSLRRWPSIYDLTTREMEVARLLCGGLTNNDLASTLGISLPTAKSHVSHIFDKLGVENRSSAVALLSQALGPSARQVQRAIRSPTSAPHSCHVELVTS